MLRSTQSKFNFYKKYWIKWFFSLSSKILLLLDNKIEDMLLTIKFLFCPFLNIFGDSAEYWFTFVKLLFHMSFFLHYLNSWTFFQFSVFCFFCTFGTFWIFFTILRLLSSFKSIFIFLKTKLELLKIFGTFCDFVQFLEFFVLF